MSPSTGSFQQGPDFEMHITCSIEYNYFLEMIIIHLMVQKFWIHSI